MLRLSINLIDSDFLLSLSKNDVKYLKLNIVSLKDTSPLPLPDELKLQKKIFGNFKKTCIRNLKISNYILIQKYRDNCWFYGKVVIIDDTLIKINRRSGSIFKTSPTLQHLDISENDTIYMIDPLI